MTPDSSNSLLRVLCMPKAFWACSIMVLSWSLFSIGLLLPFSRGFGGVVKVWEGIVVLFAWLATEPPWTNRWTEMPAYLVGVASALGILTYVFASGALLVSPWYARGILFVKRFHWTTHFWWLWLIYYVYHGVPPRIGFYFVGGGMTLGSIALQLFPTTRRHTS